MELLKQEGCNNTLSAVIATTKTVTHIGTLYNTLKEAKMFNVEVILVHDIQDFESHILIEECIAEFPDLNVKLIKGNYGNPGSARNEGIKRATGEWICFWDSDDTPHIAEIISSIESTDSEVQCLVGMYNKFNKSNGFSSVSSFPSMKNVSFEPGLWRMVFKLNSIKNVRFPALRMAEDQVFLAATKLPELSVQFSNKIFYTYHVGLPFQLTANSANSRDLLPSLRQLVLIMGKYDQAHLDFASNLFAKQLYTSLKRNSLKLKIATIIVLISALLSNSLTVSYSILRSLIMVLMRKI